MCQMSGSGLGLWSDKEKMVLGACITEEWDATSGHEGGAAGQRGGTRGSEWRLTAEVGMTANSRNGLDP